MPITCAAATLAGLSMSGIPPFIGFIGKEFMYEATMVAGAAGAWLLTIAAITGNAATIAAAGIVAVRPFHGARKETPKSPHEAPPSLYLGPVALSALGLSVLTVIFGVVTYLFWDRLRGFLIGVERAVGWGPDRGYDQLIEGVERFARAQNRRLQTGYLRHYLIVTFAVTAAATLLTMWLHAGMPVVPDIPQARMPELLAITLTVFAALAVTVLHSRLAAVAVTGVVGYGVALIFLLFSAPDLAFTQFMVETLVVVILVLVLMRLPLEGRIRRSKVGRWRDKLIATATGGTFTLILMAVTQGPFDIRLSEYFAETSVVVAHGHNIVNVILVDFRALDTLGEIFVVTTAGLSAFALIRLAMRRSATRQAPRDDKAGGAS
jgi:multicomponent Na+:H+ antiporter subunit A